MTFSVVAKCPDTGMFGVAISSSSPAVAARCSYAKAGVGAVTSQNVTDPRLGPKTLELMERGASAEQAVSIVEANRPNMQYRQILAVDTHGNTAIYSGRNSLGIFAEAKVRNAASAGNLLDNNNVPNAIIESLSQSDGHLADRLMLALQAGLQAGGEAGPVHSAGLLIVDQVQWPVVDLRCDWTESCPISQLQLAWDTYKPQLSDYVDRALSPAKAPSYGVPGNE